MSSCAFIFKEKVAEINKKESHNMGNKIYVTRPSLPPLEEFSPYLEKLVNSKEYGISRDDLYYKLQSYDIFGRRYFYPLISDFPTYRGLPSAKADNIPMATRVAKEVICLPIYPTFISYFDK